MATSFTEQRLDAFLDLVAAREPAPGGGAVAAVTVSLAAGLVAMAARYSVGRLAGGELVVEDAERWRHRATRLADEDARAYRAVIAAYQTTHGAAPADRRKRLRLALQRAAEVPLQVSAAGAAVAGAGAILVSDGNPRLRGDAATGVQLAAAAARSAACLVALNVRIGGCDEDLVRRSMRNVELAADAVERVQALLSRPSESGGSARSAPSQLSGS